jgi:hypothetical protein
MAKRIALIIATQTYQDPALAWLNAPAADLQRLAGLLRDPAIGNFSQVELLTDQPAQALRRQIAGLCHWKKPHDELLLYVVGHGAVDETGQLQLLTTDTTAAALAQTALPATYITAWLDRSFSRQKTVILDCNYFSPAAGVTLKTTLAETFKGRGHGRAVLATSHLIQPAQPATVTGLTRQVIQGLQTGLADRYGDGQIDLEELYQYLDQQLRPLPPQARLHLWRYAEANNFVLARNRQQFVASRPEIKWDLIFGAIMTPTTIIAIGAWADLRTSVGLASMFVFLYALLYWAPD